MRSWRRQVEIDWALVPQRLGDLGDRPSGLDQVQDLAPELRRVAASSHAVLLSLVRMRNPTTQLHRTGGRPEPPTDPGRFRMVGQRPAWPGPTGPYRQAVGLVEQERRP